MPVYKNTLEMYRGEKKIWSGSVSGSSGAGEDLTGGVLYFTVRKAVANSGSETPSDSDSNVVFALTSSASNANGTIAISGSNYTITVRKAATCALYIPDDELFCNYGLELVPSGDTEPVTLARGPFRIMWDTVRGV